MTQTSFEPIFFNVMALDTYHLKKTKMISRIKTFKKNADLCFPMKVKDPRCVEVFLEKFTKITEDQKKDVMHMLCRQGKLIILSEIVEKNLSPVIPHNFFFLLLHHWKNTEDSHITVDDIWSFGQKHNCTEGFFKAHHSMEDYFTLDMWRWIKNALTKGAHVNSIFGSKFSATFQIFNTPPKDLSDTNMSEFLEILYTIYGNNTTQTAQNWKKSSLDNKIFVMKDYNTNTSYNPVRSLDDLILATLCNWPIDTIVERGNKLLQENQTYRIWEDVYAFSDTQSSHDLLAFMKNIESISHETRLSLIHYLYFERTKDNYSEIRVIKNNEFLNTLFFKEQNFANRIKKVFTSFTLMT
jgi:hypothetical protein